MRALLERTHPIVLTIVAGTLLTRAAFFMTIPFLAIYLYEVKGISPGIIGLVIGTSALTGTLGGFIGGYLSDRIGRFPVMLTAIFVWSAVFAGYAFADALWHFFLLNALSGLCRSWFEPISRALLADVTTKENRLSVFNARYFAINVGAAIGPVIGTHLGTSTSTSGFLITSAFYAAYAVTVLLLMKRYQRTLTSGEDKKFSVKAAISVLAQDRVLLFFLLGNIVVMMGQAQMDSTLAQYLGSAPQFKDGVKLFSYLILVNAITVLILQYPVTNFMRRFDTMFSLRVGSIAFSLALFGFGLSNEWHVLVISMILLTIGEIIVFVMSDVLLDNLAPEHMRGTYFGAMSLRSIGFSAGPWIGGMLLEAYGFANGFYIFGTLALISLSGLPMFHLGQRVMGKSNSTKETINSGV
ncbi:MDR family MFS transporter [Fictibacillus aquaticus]|uniref:MFS transporter n=1 Tax=Fictibacillus aquaticus TaxID=2021314 RepID=A0A235FD71_9BACL|nr:MFS transporter [Fictibacillus aquaticus]OYD59169.1 MFS transporter [Fictibacillus aquaticus]